MNNKNIALTAEDIRSIFTPSVIQMVSGRDKIIYKGSDLLAQISTVEIPERTIRRLSIQVYTDGNNSIDSVMKPEGREIVLIDNLMYLVITSDKLQTLNDGELQYTALIGIGNDAFPDLIQDIVVENTFGYELKTTKVKLPTEVAPV